MPPSVSETQIAAVRAFNRFYTRKLGVLEQQLFESPFSLTEARVLYELAHQNDLSAKEIGTALGLDPGYLSRILQNFHEKALITRKALPSDRRQFRIGLTAKGRLAFGQLNRSSHDEVATMLGKLESADRTAVVHAMTVIEQALEPTARPPTGFLLRTHRPGDIGWVISRHGALYTQEYGWENSFEALVAEISAQFIRSYDASREHCWIAEVGGEPMGSIFLVKASDDVAKLRLLLVDRKARGLGVGRALTEQCIRFAREAGYKSITLWTQSILIAARGIYQRAGFQCVKEVPHHSFGVDLIGETWELKL